MSLIVFDTYLPGFTEPVRNAKLEEYLSERGYCLADGPEGAEIADIFHHLLIDNGINLLLGQNGFTGLSKETDIRNKLIASCARHNCMSQIWWLVESECAKKWLLYAGCWNEELGFMVLDAPRYHPQPVIWLSDQPEQMRPLLDLSAV